MLTDRKIALEQGRYESGEFPIRAPFQLLSLTERTDRSILQLCINLAGKKLDQEGLPAMPQAGDVVGIYPENCTEHIAILAKNLHSSAADSFFLKGRHESDEGNYYTAIEALKHVALNPLSPDLLFNVKAKLEALEEIPEEMHEGRAILDNLLQLHQDDPEACQQILQHSHLTDLIIAFPRLLDLQEVCDAQGSNYRRVYTISGIHRNEQGDPLCVHILIATGITYAVPEGGFNAGAVYKGKCSGYLERLLTEQSNSFSRPKADVFIQRRAFGPPEKDRKFIPRKTTPSQDFLEKLAIPLLLVAAGSGISGIRTILEERRDWKDQGYYVAPSTLVFGIRNHRVDFLCADDLRAFERRGILNKIILAESRPSHGSKQYVQDIFMNGLCDRELKELIRKQRGMVVCGDRRMGNMLVKGCLPMLLAKFQPELLPEDLQDFKAIRDRHELEYIYEIGLEEVKALQGQGLLALSSSGSRYPKIKIGFEEAYHAYFQDGYFASAAKQAR